MTVIGIDLGTTFSCIAHFDKNQNLEIIENKFTGSRLTPSVCTFTDSDLRIGRPSRASENSVYEIKRILGQDFNDPHVQKDIKNWSFQVVSNNQNKPLIKVNYKNEERSFYPEQISAMVFRELKKVASLHLNQDIKKAVISVPAYFSDSQRQATKDAAKIAGLEVLKILNEPTAAALAYGYHKKLDQDSKVLVFDLGGGTFDVSIMHINKGVFRVLAIDGDVHLGGSDFDNRLVKHCSEIIKNKHNVDVTKSKRAMLRLKTKCEQIKRELSQVSKTVIEIDSFVNGNDFEENIFRKTFEHINQDLFDKTIRIVESALKSANLNKSDIDDVVLVGGSSRIPKIRVMLEEFFEGKQLKQDINPDEVVAYGAAIQAALLSGEENMGIEQIVDVIPKSLGLRHGLEDRIKYYFAKNSSIPARQTHSWTTCYDFQKGAYFKIYEGEGQYAYENNLLGKFLLENIKIGVAGVPSLKCTFDIDSDGILHVSAVDADTLSKGDIVIKVFNNRLTNNEIIEMSSQIDTFFVINE